MFLFFFLLLKKVRVHVMLIINEKFMQRENNKIVET